MLWKMSGSTPAQDGRGDAPVAIRAVREYLAAQRATLIDIRRDLHAHPQLAYEETHAAAVVQRELDALSIPYRAGLGKTGVVGWLVPDGPAGDRPAVALRADMDALPITERNDLPYRSQHTGVMHACGHDGHTTMLLGAAGALAQVRDQLPQPVKLLFQPAEEGHAGAKRMIDDGALTDSVGGIQTACAFGLHGWPRLPLGTLATRIGPLLAAFDCFTITLRATGGHAAFPNLTGDVISTGAQLINALQTLVSRRIDPTAPAVLSVTRFHAGTTDNVLPPEAELSGTIRTVDDDTRAAIPEHLSRMAEHTAAMHGCAAEVVIHPGYPVTENHPEATDHARAALGEMLAPGQLLDVPRPVMGAEDFAYYSQVLPSCFLFLGTRPADVAQYPDLHTDRYDFNDDALLIGAEVLARCALRSSTTQTQ